MKRWLSLAAIAVLCMALVVGVACGGGGGEEEEGVTEIKIGIGLALSGLMGALVGGEAKQGYELAAERIGVFEVGGKQYRWKTIFEDNLSCSAEGGLATTTKFIYDDDVDFIIQSGPAAMVSQTLCEESGVFLDAGTATFDAFGPDHPYTTQSGPPIHPQIAAFYDWLAKEHPEVERITVVLMEDPIAVAFAEAYESNMHEYFGFEREIISLPMGTTEYYPTATAVMADEPDLVISSPGTLLLEAMWDMGYEGLAAQYGPIMDQSLFGNLGWDKCKGVMFFYPEWYGADELWPEAVAVAGEYEARFGTEMGTMAFAPVILLEALTGAIQEAGTVDDLGRIMETVQSRVTFDSIIGPVYYGGEDFVGINCILMTPVAIWEVAGEREYELLEYYTPEEAEAIAVEAWTATMP
jgi:ABC-type branched-subunit amino acid transport system substrate-binding protein